MRSVKLYVLISLFSSFASLLSFEVLHAQCLQNVPSNGVFVNGTLVIMNTNATGYYVGAGDSLIVAGGYPMGWFYVDGGGYVKVQVNGSPSWIYAKNGSTVDIGNSVGTYIITQESNANIISSQNNNIQIDTVCTQLIFQINSAVDSFHRFVGWSCAGPELTVLTNSYNVNMSMVTDFGDGNSVSSPIQSNNNAGYIHLNHAYQNAGFYSIRQVLYSGNNAIDSITSTYEHKYCSTMPIALYNDVNSNCIYEAGIDNTIFLPVEIEIDSVNIPVDTISCMSGFTYTAFGAAGDVYKFKILSLLGDMFASCPVTGIISDTFSQGLNDPKYLGLSYPPGNTSFDLGMHVDSRAGSHAFFSYITPLNTFSTSQNATLTMYYDPSYTSFSATPAPGFQSLGTAVWNLSGVSAVMQSPAIFVHLDGAQLSNGMLVNTSYTITPTTGDADPSDNALIVIDTAQTSYDPNAIYVKPSGCVTPGTNLEYKITFENTGPAAAENIYVLDTLPPGLDQSSMKLKFASHEMYVEKIYHGSQTILKFNFPNIMLPDSSDHAGRHGSFVYTINSRNNYPIGSAINHRVGIYFDYNDPVMTNTSSTVMCWPTNVNTTTSKQEGILIYPNPATEDLTIKTDKQYISYTISNSIGQVMMKNNLTAKESKLDIRSLAPGIYYISLKGEGSSEVRKFVKM